MNVQSLKNIPKSSFTKGVRTRIIITGEVEETKDLAKEALESVWNTWKIVKEKKLAEVESWVERKVLIWNERAIKIPIRLGATESNQIEASLSKKTKLIPNVVTFADLGIKSVEDLEQLDINDFQDQEMQKSVSEVIRLKTQIISLIEEHSVTDISTINIQLLGYVLSGKPKGSLMKIHRSNLFRAVVSWGLFKSIEKDLKADWISEKHRREMHGVLTKPDGFWVTYIEVLMPDGSKKLDIECGLIDWGVPEAIIPLIKKYWDTIYAQLDAIIHPLKKAA
jgi:hypothetical protein